MTTIQPGSDSRQNWRAINAGAASDRLQDRRLNQAREANSHLTRRRAVDVGFGMFPFKIYPALPSQIPLGADPTAAWRTVVVRAGQINGTTLLGPGCDGRDQDPRDDYLPSETDPWTTVNGVAQQVAPAALMPIIVPAATPRFYLWATLGTTGNPAKPTVTLNNGTAPGWSNFPHNDGSNIIIGFVDTSTNAASFALIIRQYLCGDIEWAEMQTCDPIPPGNPATMAFRGFFCTPPYYR